MDERRTVNACDYGHDTAEEVRRLPIGGRAGVIVCRLHFEAERRGQVGRPVEWETLPVYGADEGRSDGY